MKEARTAVKQVYRLNPPVQVGSYTVTRLGISPYQHGLGSALVLLTDSEPLCHLSVNLPELSHSLDPLEFFIKQHSENQPFYEAFTNPDRPILEQTGAVAATGHVEAVSCRLNLKHVSTRFTCPTCKKQFPTSQAQEWDETRLLYCKTCLRAIEGDLDEDIDFRAADIDIPESKIRKK